MWQDFKAFIMRGNVVDLAVGVIIGAAFGTIVKSLVDDVIMPPKQKLEDSSGDDIEGWETYGILNLDVGFIFNSAFGVSPSVSIPVGLDGSDASFTLGFAYHFGRTR